MWATPVRTRTPLGTNRSLGVGGRRCHPRCRAVMARALAWATPPVRVERTDTRMVRGACRRRLAGRSSTAGQSLVEFALVVPIFLLLMMGILEYGFLYNNILTVQYAARQGVSAAAQAGAVDGADCSILKAVERALTAPIDKARVSSVLVYKSDANGDPLPGVANQYVRSGSLDCPGSETEPYTPVGSESCAQCRPPRRGCRRDSTWSAFGSATLPRDHPGWGRAGPGPCPTGPACGWSRSNDRPRSTARQRRTRAARPWSSSPSSCPSS